MTRQQSITLAQCECKLQDANRRATDAESRMYFASSEADYALALDEYMHALKDAVVWQRTIDALRQAP